MGRMAVYINEFLTSGLYGHECCASYRAVLYLGETTHSIRWKGFLPVVN